MQGVPGSTPVWAHNLCIPAHNITAFDQDLTVSSDQSNTRLFVHSTLDNMGKVLNAEWSIQIKQEIKQQQN